MECSLTEALEEGSSPQAVQVALHIRPLVPQEQLQGCKECVFVVAKERQVQLGSSAFTFDHVYGMNASSPSNIFDECVAPLVDGLFHGYNATVLAYGQTGSGKTYTMGTGDNAEGIVRRVMQTLFMKINQLKCKADFELRVSFIEILKEDILDLLEHSIPSKLESCTGAFGVKSFSPSPGRAPIVIRETTSGGISLTNVTEIYVKTLEEMSSCLEQGSLSRATGSTNMNSTSSRSHAIFTINMEQHKGTCFMSGESILSAKLHLVDLAGSERAKRTGTDGVRFKEGVHINKGLLALGNVISALADDKKRKICHIPYRDSKLTRLLQDSLGGNSRTVMIACISPADSNAEETLNTLKYANRARNIQTKVIVNRDPVTAELQSLRQQVALLQNRLQQDSPYENEQGRVAWLEARNSELSEELQQAKEVIDALTQQEFQIQLQPEHFAKVSEQYTIQAIAEKQGTYNEMESKETDPEIEHTCVQDSLDKELQGLNAMLAQKEAEMYKFSKSDSLILEHHFQKKLLELEDDKNILQKEKEALIIKLGSLAAVTDEHKQRMHTSYVQKLKQLEQQISDLKKQQETQSRLLKQKQISEEAARRLQDDIYHIKQQKVQLQQKIKQESEQFRLWKVAREKELMQLKKEGRRNEHEMHKLRALHQHQKMILQRKTEQAAATSRRLKEVLETRKSNVRHEDNSAQGNNKKLQCWLDHEIEAALHASQIRLAYHDQTEARTAFINELEKLKVGNLSTNTRDSKSFVLEDILNTTSEALVAMASELSEAEERHLSRWQNVNHLSDAKALLSFAFDAAVCSRWEAEEKEREVYELVKQIADLHEVLRISEKHKISYERQQRLKEQAVAVALAAATKAGADLVVKCGMEELSNTLSNEFIDSGFSDIRTISDVKKNPGKLWKWKHRERLLPLRFKWKWQKPWGFTKLRKISCNTRHQ